MSNNLYISEYVDLPFINARQAAIVEEPAKVEQVVTFTTHTESSAFGNSTKVVRLHTDAICSVLFGLSPTATTSSKRMAANQTEYFKVTPGHKVSVVSNT